MLARLHAQAGDAKKALEAAQQAQAISPDNPEVLDVLGAIQIAAGEKEQAVTTYAKLVALQPNSPEALLRLADAQAVKRKRGGSHGVAEEGARAEAGFRSTRRWRWSSWKCAPGVTRRR